MARICKKAEVNSFTRYSKDREEKSKGGDPWFNIVCCDNCGHVYGVFAKHVASHDVPVVLPRV